MRQGCTVASTFGRRQQCALARAALHTVHSLSMPGLDFCVRSVMSFTQLSDTYLMRGINPGVLSGGSAKALSRPAPTSGRCKAGTVIPADWDWRSSNIGSRVPLIRPSQGRCESLSCPPCRAAAALRPPALAPPHSSSAGLHSIGT